jgi:hypothetical protein
VRVLRMPPTSRSYRSPLLFRAQWRDLREATCLPRAAIPSPHRERSARRAG